MSYDPEKSRLREIRSRVRRILLHEWDPIGIRHEPEASGEYDRYADRVCVMLVDEEATADTIAADLNDVASEDMCFGRSQRGLEHCRHVAEILVALRSRFGTR